MVGAIILVFFAKKKRVDNPDDSNEEAAVHTLDWVKDVLITLALIAVSMAIFYTVQA